MIVLGFVSLKRSLKVSTTTIKGSVEHTTLILLPTNQSNIQYEAIKSWNHSKQQPTSPGFNDHVDQVFPSQQKSFFNHTKIPKFMMEYLEWHGKQLQKLHTGAISWTPQIVNSINHVAIGTSNQTGTRHKHDNKLPEIFPRFLIMRCIDGDRCGGTSDRLKAFPLFILLAQESDRILFIRWGRDRPFPITEFLRPGPLWNWTVPEPLLRHLEEGDHNSGHDTSDNSANEQPIVKADRHRRVYYDGTKFNQLRQSSLDATIWVVEGNDYSGGAGRYQNLLAKQQQVQPKNGRSEDTNYANFYHDLFHGSFLPSPAIEMLLQSYLDQDYTNNSFDPDPSLPVRMQPNGYVVAHYRAKYPGEPYRQTWNVSILEKTVLHAVNCAAQRGPSNLATVFVASDTALALQAVYNNNQYHLQRYNNLHVWTYLHLQSLNAGENSDAHGASINTTLIPFAVDPPHLNFAKLDNPSGFYGIFVDLFLMSYSYCVVYGAGGFGRFGSLVSFHPWCGTSFTHQNGVLQQCRPCMDVQSNL
jgi:hypothetical protein